MLLWTRPQNINKFLTGESPWSQRLYRVRTEGKAPSCHVPLWNRRTAVTLLSTRWSHVENKLLVTQGWHSEVKGGKLLRWGVSLMLSEPTGLHPQCPWWLVCLAGAGIGDFEKWSSWQEEGHLGDKSLKGNVGSLGPSCFSLYLLAIASYYQQVLRIHRRVAVGSSDHEL